MNIKDYIVFQLVTTVELKLGILLLAFKYLNTSLHRFSINLIFFMRNDLVHNW